MKTEDLRIGNLILDFDNEVCEVLELHKGTFETTINGYKVDDTLLRQFKPIPLTEEWLLRFGFRHRVDNEYMLILHDCVFLFDLDTNTFTVGFVSLKCEYVHQLQNIYFVFRNEELTLKETTI